MSRGSSKRPAMVAFALAGLCAAMLVMLTGCDDQPQPAITEALVVIKIVDTPAPDWPAGSAAITRGSGTGLSTIEILRDYYPECLEHEIRHVFEGAWHDQRTTCR